MLPSSPLIEQSNKLSLLLDLGALLAREVELDALLSALSSRIAEALHAERATLYLVDDASNELVSHVTSLPVIGQIRLPAGKGIAGYVAETGEVVNLRDAATDPRFFSEVDKRTGFRSKTMLTAPIRDSRRAIRGVVQVLNKHDGTFSTEDEAFLLALAAQVAQALEGTTLRPAAGSARGVSLRGPFNHIVGASEPMRAVYEQIQRAASTDATVLLRGETGVGKGLFARAIHANSAKRAARELVTVDCTTLPPTLIESELFGHEKGAFTGADRRVIGKVERAHEGTLFLDEVGELAPAVQAKLLRLVQDKSFERVGGRAPQQSDARIVAATHRDLEAMVAKGEFRQDLFYRLRVVEVTIPPLRARGAEEVLRLSEHFLAMYARRHGRGEMQVSPGARRLLCEHDWPGNVRELEHAIERAVVTAPTIRIEPQHLGLPARTRARSDRPPAPTEGVHLPLGLSLAEVERRYVAATLAKMEGNVSRTAESLGISRNRLKRKR
ncbi:MAG: sigma-54-dependent Fis family transcriptional regulator [Myxococcales bacterium]|nr:sigma-54-dependent Fis family transcriptional regulator [Myxococcales bacterium]